MHTQTIGIDVSDKKSTICILDAGGAVVERSTCATTRSGVEVFFKDRGRAVVVLEVGTHSRWMSAQLKDLGHDVVVANPFHVRLIYAGRNKNDVLDAESLARLARVDRKLLHEVQHRSRDAQTSLALIRSRDVLVRSRTNFINHVRATVKSDGGRVPSCDADAFAKKSPTFLPAALSAALQPIVEMIGDLTERIRGLDRTIEHVSKTLYPETARLLQVPGVGPVTALSFVLSIEDEKRFTDARQIGPFLGLVPRQRQSGEMDPHLRITKAGNGYLRRLLVNCAHHIISRGPDTDLQRFGNRLCPPGAKRKKRAVVAVARKLSVLLLRLWQSKNPYQPLRAAA